MEINKVISEELDISISRIDAAINLFDEGNTIAFIARYRKEVTGALTDEDLRKIEKKLIYYRNLEEKKVTVLSTLEKLGVLTPELKEQIDNCLKVSELEDIYRPYKPKKKTRASEAIAKGLKPVADLMIQQLPCDNFEEYLKSFINEEKKVKTIEDVLQGAEDIVAEYISDNPDYRHFLKSYLYKNAFITSKEIDTDEKHTFEMYKDYKEAISKIPNFRVLALNRGSNLKMLRVKIDYEDPYVLSYLNKKVAFKNLYESYINLAVTDSLKRLLSPSIENEIFSELFERAEDSSIIIFGDNLRELLLYPPLKGKTVMGFDPGFRTGCKIGIVNQNGDMLGVDIANVTLPGNDERIAHEVTKIVSLIKKYNVNYIALGNGTASRESEAVLSKMIKDYSLDVKLTIVNESGASVYSASELGQKEFPDLHVEKRSAISLARRLQDPLAEYVKIDPKAIGVGQYQHDMTPSKLDYSLNGIVEEVVNKVGVNLNTASVSLLKYVSGINEGIAKNIIEYRIEHNGFKSREELLKVKKLGEKAYQQCAGFLRIRDAKNPFDNTGIHPESYALAEEILEVAGIKKEDILDPITQAKIQNLYESGFFNKKFPNISETQIDIIKELMKPGHDARDDAEIVELDNSVKSIEDLKVGMILTGVVHNICDFGAFVDINVHQDGLVHISEISKDFIKHPSEALKINQIVKVKVINVDVAKKKIGLSIKQVE